MAMALIRPIAILGQAKTISIDPIQESSVKNWKTELYIFGLGGSEKSANLWTATNHFASTIEKRGIYSTNAELGITASIYRNYLMKYSASASYMRNRCAINRGLHLNGLCTDWVCLGLDVGAQIGGGLYYFAGVKSALFLSGRKSNTGNYAYPGLNIDCYNKFALNWHIGAEYCYKIFKLSGKMGFFINPLLNANKIAYYNMGKTYVSGSVFFEVGAAIRIFTTSSKYVSIE